MTQRTRSVLALVAWVALCFAAAGLGSVATARSVDTWYQELTRPSFSPPDWVFGPVWTVLYGMMAAATLVAFWRTSRAAGVLLAPYLAWVSYAGALNFALWRLNP
ncbi:MAG: TspO/MBR family protein [Planctomycetota bacterium]